MKLKKRTKATRYRGTHTHGRGAKKKARGSGHRGGFGKAGTGKKADQKKGMYGAVDYFGKRAVRRAADKKKLKTFSLGRIADGIDFLVSNGIAKKSGVVYELDLKKYKIIGNDSLNLKLKIFAAAASEGAVSAVEKAGGEIVLEKKVVKSESKSANVGVEKKKKVNDKKDSDED
jgi:large subunit ribosomal protein L15